MSSRRHPAHTQFNLAAFLLAASLAPPIFGLYAGAFGKELQVLAVVIGLAGVGVAVYLAAAVLALLAVYLIPLALWRFGNMVRSRPTRAATGSRIGC